jgi:leucyl aminopeptidase
LTPRFVAAPDVPVRAEVLGVPVFSDLSTPPQAGADLNRRFLAQRGFEGKPGQAQALLADDGSTVVALGVGDKGSVDGDILRRAGAALARNAGTAKHAATTLTAAAPDPELAAAVVEGIGLGAYRYQNGPTESRSKTNRLERVTVVGASKAAVARGQAAVDATCRARDWVNTPPADLTPSALATAAAAAAEQVGVEAEVWDERRIRSERLGGLLGVAAGASEPPRLIRLTYRAPGPGPGPTVALVGKGITFDSGGLSLKTADGMTTMKTDMSGAAAVIATLGSCRDLNVPVRVVGITPISENMPGGRATKPGDVLRIRNGKTIEVLNTDAEGRLVLADGLCLATEERPDAIIDLATLTGACVVALGRRIAGLMGNDDRLIAQVSAASARAGESTWHLPLPDEYKSHIESEIADMKNIGSPGQAGALSAGLLLAEFVGDTPWAHLDIAGPARSEEDRDYLHKGATGFGVRTLIELLGRFEPVRSDADRQARHAVQGDAGVEGEHAPGAGGDSHPGQPDPPSTSGPYGLRGDARGDSHPQAF